MIVECLQDPRKRLGAHETLRPEVHADARPAASGVIADADITKQRADGNGDEGCNEGRLPSWSALLGWST